MTAPTVRLSRPALASAVVLLLTAACGDDVQGPPGERLNTPTVELLSTLIVSNPVTFASTGAARLTLGGFSSSEPIVFVSLPPGSVPKGETAVIQARSAEARATAAMVDGGFDPVPLAAATGDTLDIRIELAGGGGSLEFFAVVPPPIPPVIVRTDPPPKKRDVPLNAVMLIVFSEPIDAASVTASSVRLLRGSVPVPGAIELGGGDNLALKFTPAEPLVPGDEYTLLITRDIADVDGDALAEEHRVEFGTEVESGTATTLEIHADLSDGAQYVIVFRDNRVVQNSVVTLNGRVLGRGSQDCVAGDCLWAHQGNLNLSAGSTVLFEATAAGLAVRANGRVPETPVLTAPPGGSTFALADSITATWTSAADPDEFWLGYDNNHFGCCQLLSLAPGVAREKTFAAADIAFGLGGTIPIMLHARNTADFTGPVDPKSFILFWSGLAESSITITP